MSLTTIPYQPIVFNTEIDPCAYCDEMEYCQLVEPQDILYIQFLQSPCGENLICDATFSRISDDLVANGTFTGSAASWTLGAAWSYAANIVSFAGGVGHGTLDQTLAIAPISGKVYIVKCTISNVTGVLALQAELGGGLSMLVQAAGSYQLLVVAGAGTDLKFIQNINVCTFDIDNIELYEIAPCWDAAAYWAQTEFSGLYHAAGSATPILLKTGPLTNGVRYHVIFHLENVTAGSVNARCGTQAGTVDADADGIWEDWITANGTDFGFLPTSDFEGYVTFVDVKVMNDDFEITLSDLITEIDYVPAISDADSYYNEFLTFAVDLASYQEAFGFADESCFRLIIEDECDEYADNIVRGGNFITNNDDFDEWDSGGGNFNNGMHNIYTTAVVGGLIKQYFDGGSSEVIGITGDYFPGILRFKYRIKVWGYVNATAFVLLKIGGRDLINIVAPGEYEGETTLALECFTNAIRVETASDPMAVVADYVYISEIEIYPITEVDDTYTSNCIKYAPEHDCTRLVQAYAEGEERSWGFEYYNTGFKLSQRLELSISQPSYPDEEENYQYSDGTRSVNYATSEKYWKCGTYFLPEEAHDCLRLQRLSDHFLIDGVEYYAKKGGHNPVWKEQCQSEAPVQFDIRLKTDPTYNRNGI